MVPRGRPVRRPQRGRVAQRRARLRARAGSALEEPVRLSVEPGAEGTRLDWRTLIVLEEGAEAEVWEQLRLRRRRRRGSSTASSSSSLGAGRQPALRLRAGAVRATAGCSRPSAPSSSATPRWSGSRSASARRAARCGWRPSSPAAGSSAKVTGAYAGRGRQHLDFDTTQEHAAPHTTSDLAFRGVLADRATAVWRGMIRVDPGAQQTDAFQESRNLLLSQAGARRRDPGARDRGQRRPLHPRGRGRPGRPRAALLPARARPAGAAGQAADHRRLPAGARRAGPRGPGPRRRCRRRSSAGSPRSSRPLPSSRGRGGGP